jgi:hypothetical protein
VNHEGKFQFPEPFVGCELIGDLNAEDLLNEFCINHTFKCGLALITDSISLLNGYINISGDTVIPISYVNASYFSEDIAPVLTKVETDSANHSVVENTGKYGFIDKTGKEVVPCKYDDAEYFSEGLARVELNGKLGIIDKTGKEIVPCKYDLDNNENH